MTFDYLIDVNFVAVFVAAVVYFAMGAIWYIPPVMGRRWQRAGGIVVREGEGANPAVFLATFGAYFLAALATALIAVASDSDTFAEAIVVGLIVGIGYALTAAAITALYDRKPQPVAWWLINGLFNIAGLLVMSIIICLWQ